MYFANPLGLLGLLSLPIIAAIHLYHRRFPPMEIAGAHLWGVEMEMRSAGRRRDKLPITATLLLELLAALLLTLILSQPQFGIGDSATHLVVILDNSASMMAKSSVSDKPATLRDIAIANLEQQVSELDSNSRFTLILTGRRTVMLAGPAVRWSEAKKELKNWQPHETAHNFDTAWDLASQLAGETGQMLFLTDRISSEDSSPTKKNSSISSIPKRMEIISVGERIDNIAISSARWTFDAVTGKGAIFLMVNNLGRKDATVTITGTTKTKDKEAKVQTIFQQRISISAGKEVPLKTIIPGGLGEVFVTVASPNDALEIDSSMTLIEPKVRMLTIANSLKNAAALNATNKVIDSTPAVQMGDEEDAHLVIAAAGTLPPSRDDLWWLGIGPVKEDPAIMKAAKSLLPPFLMEKRNPLLDGVVLGGVIWGGVQPVDLRVTPIISTGKYPLLARLKGTLTTGYIMNIDFKKSNLAESPDWPILLSNIIEQRRENLPGLRRWNYRINEQIRFRLYEGLQESEETMERPLLLIHEDGKSRSLARTSIVELPQLSQTGLYTLKDGDKTIDQFAINFFDEEESTLTSLRPGIHQAEITDTTADLHIDNTYTWLIWLAIFFIIIAVLVDWKILKPKVFGR